MKRFYFNTGVRFSDYPYLYGNQVNRGGTKQIPLDVDDSVPDNAGLLFCCNDPDLPESKMDNVIVASIHNSDIESKFAYFMLRSVKGK